MHQGTGGDGGLMIAGFALQLNSVGYLVKLVMPTIWADKTVGPSQTKKMITAFSIWLESAFETVKCHGLTFRWHEALCSQ